MKREDRKLGKNDKQLKFKFVLLLCVANVLLPFLMVADSKAADPAADYPSKPIEFVTTAPGSSWDVLGRLMIDIIKRENILSQPMFVTNKPGSGAVAANGYVFEKKGNPYVVLGVASTIFTVTPLLEKLAFTHKSFTPIANLTLDGTVLVVRGDSPFKTADDIIAEAKKRPNELIQGAGSYTSGESLMGKSMQKVKGVQWKFIPFAAGDPECITNLLGGNIHFAFTNPSGVLDYVRVGKLKVILTGAPNRYAEFKDVPTIKEAGMGEPICSYRGLAGPPNMPEYAVKKLEAAFKKSMENVRFKKYVEETAMQPFWLSSHEYGKHLDSLHDRYKLLLGELGLLKK